MLAWRRAMLARRGRATAERAAVTQRGCVAAERAAVTQGGRVAAERAAVRYGVDQKVAHVEELHERAAIRLRERAAGLHVVAPACNEHAKR